MDKSKEILYKLINFKTQQVDFYTHKNSVWLILTEEKKWVIELTKEGTLWYNYYFFENCFRPLGLEVTKNEHYITEWVENIIQNGQKHTHDPNNRVMDGFDGVKHTDACQIGTSTSIEDAIQNGVKDIRWGTNQRKNPIEDTIQNGVKETIHNFFEGGLAMEEVIQNGVKETNPHFLEILNPMNFEPVTKEMKRMNEVNIVLENGIKETTPGGYLGSVEIKGKTVHQFETAKQLYYLEDVINDGIKEVKELPDKSGELRGYGEYYQNQEDRTKPHTQYMDDVIRDGIKETKYCELHSLMRADHVIRDGIKETWGYEKQPQMRVHEVLDKGITQTHWRRVDNHPTYVDNIINKNN